MPEETTEKLNESPIQNWNPYNLIDHPEQFENKESVQNWVEEKKETKESGQFFKKIVKSIAKTFWLPDPETGEPTKKVVEWQSNQENDTQTAAATETTLEQDVVAQEETKLQEWSIPEVEKKNFSFENVMSGVSGVLNKIEKKVEEKTWIDLDAPLKKREENLANNTWETDTPITETEQPIQSVQPTAEQVTTTEVNENPVEKNNEEYLSENH